jgi:hypothetical protein
MGAALSIAGKPAFRAPRRGASREDIEAAIAAALDAAHQLIAYLDTLDGDPDLEPEEPESGAREWCGSSAHRFDVGAVA